jgi:glycine betaine transporter
MTLLTRYIHSLFNQRLVILVIPGLLVMALLGVGFANPYILVEITNNLNQFIFQNFGRFYLLFGLITLLIFPIIAISPLGSIRLGGANAQPNHSWFSWIAMLFTCGMGIGFMLWGAAEPLYHYLNPPLLHSITSEQREAAAFYFTFLHWGLEPWAIYGMTALVIGFLGFNLRRGFSLGSFIDAPDPEKRAASVHAFFRQTVDVVMVVAIIFGIAATLASGVLNLEGGLQVLAHTPTGIPTEIVITLVLALIYITSAARGIDQGLKVLSNISVILSFLLLGALIWVGPQSRMVDILIHDVPTYLEQLLPLSLGIGEFREADWLNQWTIKYWSWWIAWAPFVGLFIATISRGRTIRELLIAVMLVPSIYSLLWFTVLGETAIALQQSTTIVGESFDWNNVTTLLFSVLEYYTGNPALSWLGIGLVAIFICNSADSASYIMACFTDQNIKEDGKHGLQVFWGILFAILTISLLVVSSSTEYNALFILQQINQITALPFTILLLIVFGKVVLDIIGYWYKIRKKKSLG